MLGCTSSSQLISRCQRFQKDQWEGLLSPSLMSTVWQGNLPARDDKEAQLCAGWGAISLCACAGSLAVGKGSLWLPLATQPRQSRICKLVVYLSGLQPGCCRIHSHGRPVFHAAINVCWQPCSRQTWVSCSFRGSCSLIILAKN